MDRYFIYLEGNWGYAKDPVLLLKVLWIFPDKYFAGTDITSLSVCPGGSPTAEDH